MLCCHVCSIVYKWGCFLKNEKPVHDACPSRQLFCCMCLPCYAYLNITTFVFSATNCTLDRVPMLKSLVWIGGEMSIRALVWLVAGGMSFFVFLLWRNRPSPLVSTCSVNYKKYLVLWDHCPSKLSNTTSQGGSHMLNEWSYEKHWQFLFLHWLVWLNS